MPTGDGGLNGGGGGGGGGSNRVTSGSNSTSRSQFAAAEPWAAAPVFRPGDPTPEPSRPTELILDFSATGRDTRRPLTRRGHVKSRLGCLSCKRRRVKCDERRPICGQCGRLKLSCSYPLEARRQPANEQEEKENPASSSSAAVASTPVQQPVPRSVGTAMNLDHLAFYHQFLTVAYPSIPVREQSAWAACAAMAHQYDYLAHAVLALGASHLTANTSADWAPQALQHRMTALRLINERLGKPIESSAEGDALMGALICLCSQSSLATDSVHEYLAMSRGSYLVSQTVVIPMNGSIFKSITDSRHLDMLLSMFEEQPKDFALIEEFQKYTESLAKICNQKHELQYQSLLYRSISCLATTPLESVRAFTALFVLPGLFDNDSFTDFTREDNHVAHLLMATMFLLDYLLGQTCFPKSETPKCGGRKEVLVNWVYSVVSRLPGEYREFGDFPVQLCKKLATWDSRYLFWP